MHFLYYEILKNFVGYDRSTDYSDSLGLVDFAFALMKTHGPHRFGIYIIYYSFQFKNLSL